MGYIKIGNRILNIEEWQRMKEKNLLDKQRKFCVELMRLKDKRIQEQTGFAHEYFTLADEAAIMKWEYFLFLEDMKEKILFNLNRYKLNTNDLVFSYESCIFCFKNYCHCNSCEYQLNRGRECEDSNSNYTILFKKMDLKKVFNIRYINLITAIERLSIKGL